MTAPTHTPEWTVQDGGFVTSKHLVRMGCHHKKTVSACGGCYARLNAALKLIEMQPDRASEIVKAVTEAMKAEFSGKKAGMP